MNLYETIYIIKPDVEEEALKPIVEKFKALIEVNGEFETIDDWGKRKLAYEIKKVNEGSYVLINFSADSELPKELDRVFRISDSIIRHLIVNLEK